MSQQKQPMKMKQQKSQTRRVTDSDDTSTLAHGQSTGCKERNAS